MLKKTLESPLDSKEIKPVNPKSILNIHWKDWFWSWSSNALSTCEELTHWKRPWYWERLKAGGESDDRGWDAWMDHHLGGHEFEPLPGAGEGQRSLECCSPWGRKDLDKTEWLNWTDSPYQIVNGHSEKQLVMHIRHNTFMWMRHNNTVKWIMELTTIWRLPSKAVLQKLAMVIDRYTLLYSKWITWLPWWSSA